MHEVRPGVWHWQSHHPDWNEEQWWPPEVSSYAIEVGDEVLLFDPLAVPDELARWATAIVLTAPYHERDARALVRDRGLPVHTPPADTWEDWVEKFGIDPSAFAEWRATTSRGFVPAKATRTSTGRASGRSACTPSRGASKTT